MSTVHETWIKLPPARRGAKCPVSGWSRRKIQQLIYGIPQRGIPAKVRYKHVPDQGRGDQGITYVHVPSLMAHMIGEPEMDDGKLASLRTLAQSPAFCQAAFNTILKLSQDRAGLTCMEALTYIFTNANHELRNDLRPDSNPLCHPVSGIFRGIRNELEAVAPDAPPASRTP